MIKLYSFVTGRADGNASMREILGTKGAVLAELARLGVPVPPGFTIPASVGHDFFKTKTLSPALKRAVKTKLHQLERQVGRSFGDAHKPLLISVRSGSEISMPGMLETILNLGTNDETVEGLIRSSGNPIFAYDTYRRLIEMYLVTVKGVDYYAVQQPLTAVRTGFGIAEDAPLSEEALRASVAELKSFYRSRFGEDFPQDVWTQLWTSIQAVLSSWNCPRARRYRQIHRIPDNLGTAVNICTMVFGNRGEKSGTGVCFTRDPSTGERILYGEYLVNAQGEDVVAGIRTPMPIESLREAHPSIYANLSCVARLLESHFRDLQDLEFTVEEGTLWILQARQGKRSARATFRIAVDFVKEGFLSIDEAVTRVDAAAFAKLLMPVLDARVHKPIIARGLAASPGAASGQIVFSSEDAERRTHNGESVILVREDTSPDDIAGIHAARGLLTTRGGMTSHAAIVARQMGKCCVAGCSGLRIIAQKGILRSPHGDLHQGEWLTIDGCTGDVIRGRVATQEAMVDNDVQVLLDWARDRAIVPILATVDSAREVTNALSLGAAGVGLCRTEQVFFDADVAHHTRCALVAKAGSERITALAATLVAQRDFYRSVITASGCKPVTFRLFDHHLAAFVTEAADEIERVAADTGLSTDDVVIRFDALREANPALGLRGCRIGIAFPELYDAQVVALVQAMVESLAGDVRPDVRLMVPFVTDVREISWFRKRIYTVAARELTRLGASESLTSIISQLPIGVFVETPRAVLRAGDLIQHADFLCLALRELSQLAAGFHPDNVDNFMRSYKLEGVFGESDPMRDVDYEKELEMVELAVTRARAVRPEAIISVVLDADVSKESRLLSQELALNGLICTQARLPTWVLASAQRSIETPSQRKTVP